MKIATTKKSEGEMWGWGVRLGGGRSGQEGTGVCVRRIGVIEKMQKKSWGEGVPIGSKVGGSG